MSATGYHGRRGPADKVTPELRREVLRADDHHCVAPRLDALADHCRDRWGTYIHMSQQGAADDLTLDHVQDHGGRMGKRAPSDRAHLVTLCWHHHLDGWATSHRPQLRAYIAQREQRRAQDGQATADG